MVKATLFLLVMAAFRLETVIWHDGTTKKEYAFIPMNTSITINAARRKCMEIGGEIPEPRSRQENYAMRDLAFKNGIQWYWIDINDKDNEGRWVFSSDNSLVKFEDWYGHNPDNGHHAGEDCVEVRSYSEYGWNDIYCGSDLSVEGRGIVCEKCVDRYFGVSCSSPCNCVDNCDRMDGKCPSSCTSGWKGLSCQQGCQRAELTEKINNNSIEGADPPSLRCSVKGDCFSVRNTPSYTLIGCNGFDEGLFQKMTLHRGYWITAHHSCSASVSHAIEVTCLIRSTTGNITAKYEKTLLYPPEIYPIIKINGKPVNNGGQVMLPLGGSYSAICSVHGGNPNTTNLTLSCEGHDPVSNDNSVQTTTTAEVVKQMDGKQCVCQGDHESGCYRKNTTEVNLRVIRKVDMIYPIPVVITQAFYVKCSVPCIGGVETLEDIGDELIVERLTLYRNGTDGNRKMIAEYYAVNDGHKEWGDLPKGVKKGHVIMDRGDSIRNALTAKILMVVKKADWEHITEYTCKIKYRTGDGYEGVGFKELQFSQTPTAEKLYLGVTQNLTEIVNKEEDEGRSYNREIGSHLRQQRVPFSERKDWHAVLVYVTLVILSIVLCFGGLYCSRKINSNENKRRSSTTTGDNINRESIEMFESSSMNQKSAQSTSRGAKGKRPNPTSDTSTSSYSTSSSDSSSSSSDSS